MQACPSCNHVLQDNDRFCRNCGAPRPAEQSAPPVNIPPASANANASKSDVSMAAFIGLILLFMIPVVGFIAAIVLSFFVKKNETIVNFSRAALIIIVVMALLQYLLLQTLASLIGFIVNRMFADVVNQMSVIEPTITSIADILRLFVD